MVAGSYVMIGTPPEHHLKLCSCGAWDITKAQQMKMKMKRQSA